MINLRHPAFPAADVCSVKMRLNGRLFRVMTPPATCSGIESPMLAQQLRDPNEVPPQIEPRHRRQYLAERTAGVLPYKCRLIPKGGVGTQRICIKQNPASPASAGLPRQITPRREDFS
ncbi:hypothetical protein ACVJBD_007415 [Rhizobium mongolense]